MRRSIALVAAALALFPAGPALAAPAGAEAEPKSEMFYVITAHPDDELVGWSMVDAHTDDYTVFITMTRGENTSSCMTAEEASAQMQKNAATDPEGDDQKRKIRDNTAFVEGFEVAEGNLGPFKYQGPDSPVGEPNKQEEKPFANPWVGQFSDACGDARIASWHWFLDDMHGLDGSGTSMEVDDPWADDDFQGTFCPAGHSGRGDGRPVRHTVTCADVWADAEGARVAFTYPNGDPQDRYLGDDVWPRPGFTVDDVTAVIQTVRQERTRWGLPELHENGILGANYYFDGDVPGCLYYDHPEHAVVLDALRSIDQGAGPRYGPIVCPDRYSEGVGVVNFPQNPAETVLANLIDADENRIGPFVRNYGWVMSTYTFFMSRSQYWEVSG